jgi:hypothetical protein
MEHINTRGRQNPVIRKVRTCEFLGVILGLVRNVTSLIGHAIAQAVTGWLITADAWFQSQSGLCGIDGLSGTERGFSVRASVVPHHFQSTGVPHSSTHLSPTLHRLSN